jgi:hypothetical protein
MSNDPFANTTTVKNILNHIISPKIVKDGSGYTTKTDLVNIDNLIFASRGNGTGTEATRLTAQCGVVGVPDTGSSVTVYHSRVTLDSIIIATNKTTGNNKSYILSVTPVNQSFVIQLSSRPGGDNHVVSWFIASF